MLTKYVHAAMLAATYEILADDSSYFGRIPGFDGVWANAPTLERCREELEEVLEDWLLFRISEKLPIPTIGGIELTIRKVA
jgi:predicted RNase H-like HicB family nuclease